MKSIFAFFLTLTSFNAAMAYYTEAHTCKSSNGQMTFTLRAVNRPDTSIEDFDSASPENQDEYGSLEYNMSLNGKDIPAKIKMTSFKTGTSTERKVTYPDGKTCMVGFTTESSHAVATVIFGTKAHQIKFNCTTVTTLPNGAIDCE